MLGIDTAIGWAHWKVRGGWRNTLLTTGAYAGIVILIILLTVRSDPRGAPQILSGWRMGLLMLMGGLLVFLAGSRVSAAVRSDITNRMIESHRLMPVSPFIAITGYLWGPTAQSVFMAAATFIIGLVVVMQAGIPADSWMGSTVILLEFAVFFWVVMAFLASIVKSPAAVMIIGAFLTMSSQLIILAIAPGVLTFLTPFTGNTAFQVRRGGFELPWTLVFSWCVHLWVAIALYIGAARKYRRSKDSALGILPGLMLLAGWLVASAFAVINLESLVMAYRMGREDTFELNFMGTFWVAIVLALIPISNAIPMRGAGWRMPLVALVAAMMIWPIGFVWSDRVDHLPRTLAFTALIAAGFLLSCGYILSFAHRFSIRGWIPILIWLCLLGAAPLVVDSILWGMRDTNRDYVMSEIAGLSPAGALAIVWFGATDASAMPGLIAQLIITAIWAAIAPMWRRRARPIPA